MSRLANQQTVNRRLTSTNVPSVRAATPTQNASQVPLPILPMTLINVVDDDVCSAQYVDGTLTVSKGSKFVAAQMNGAMLSEANVFGPTSPPKVELINTFSSTGENVQIGSVSWSAAGAMTTIFVKSISVTGVATEFTCVS